MTVPQQLEPYSLDENPSLAAALRHGKLPYSSEQGETKIRSFYSNEKLLKRSFSWCVFFFSIFTVNFRFSSRTPGAAGRRLVGVDCKWRHVSIQRAGARHSETVAPRHEAAGR